MDPMGFGKPMGETWSFGIPGMQKDFKLIRVFFFSELQVTNLCNKITMISWWLNHPFEKNMRKSNWIISPKIGLNI